MPPSGTIAIIQFAQSGQAKAALSKLAYRRIGDSVLFLEAGPQGLFKGMCFCLLNLSPVSRIV